jgi:hypothetical protein
MTFFLSFRRAPGKIAGNLLPKQAPTERWRPAIGRVTGRAATRLAAYKVFSRLVPVQQQIADKMPIIRHCLKRQSWPMAGLRSAQNFAK